MGLIPEHILEQVRMAHAIEEIVGRTVELKRSGRNFKACCPFHDEKTPSFHVNVDRQTWKCFGCGLGGNVFGFLMQDRGISFPEAVRSLAEERGIVVPDTRGVQTTDDMERLKRFREALAFARDFFAQQLQTPAGARARTYLAGRGYDIAAQEQHGLGYAPDAWDGLIAAARARGITIETLQGAGLVQERKTGQGAYDRFRNRIMFPVRDLHGRVVTFGARALEAEDNPKYLNGPETQVFHKSSLLYALDEAQRPIRDAGVALLMEGYTDVLMAHIHGFQNAVAGMGTAFTPQQARLLRRYCDRVVLVYDSDSAGQAAAERGVETLLEAGLEVRVAMLPAGRDVDEILLEEGPPAFQAILDGARELLHFMVARLSERFDLDTPHGRARAIEALLPLLRKLDPLTQDQLVRALSEDLGGQETERVLRQMLAGGGPGAATVPPRGKVRRAEMERVLGRHAVAGAPDETEPDSAKGIIGRERDEARIFAALLGHPELRDGLFRALGPEDFTVPAFRRLYNAVLDLEEAGASYDVHSLIARAADDAEAASRLADLPEEEDLVDFLQLQLAEIEKRRRRVRSKSEFQALADRFRAGGDSAAPTTTDSRARPRNPDPLADVDTGLPVLDPSDEMGLPVLDGTDDAAPASSRPPRNAQDDLASPPSPSGWREDEPPMESTT
jgi:DNA primase